MDNRERAADLNTLLIAALSGWQAGIWTALPCLVESFDPTVQTASLRPAIQAQLQNPDGSFQWVKLPLLVDVPVIFPSGGGYTLTFPLGPGDEVLAIFASRCIDGWWSSGKVSVQSELRMHELSDAFAIPQPRSKPHALGGFSAGSAQLRSDDGETYVELGPGVINLKAATIKIEATASLELKCNHGVVWDPGTIHSYQQGVPSTLSGPPAP